MNGTMDKFDYEGAVAELEKIVETVENPDTGIDEIDRYVSRSEELVEKCRAYLRGVRERIDKIDV